MTERQAGLAGKRVLVVKDEALVAIRVADGEY